MFGESSHLGQYDTLPQVARPHGGINWLEEGAPDGIRNRSIEIRGSAKTAATTATDNGQASENPNDPARDGTDQRPVGGIWIDPTAIDPSAIEEREKSEQTAAPEPSGKNHVADYMAIVPPTWRKEVWKGGLAHQWSVMKHGLERARKIVFIGYSLPRSDLYFRHFLALALCPNNFLPRVYVWNPSILDPASDEHESYVDLFEPLAREGRLFGVAGRFGDPALFDLARAMREATPLRGP